MLYAWSAPDVLFIAMVTTTLEIGLFLDFALGDRCAAINAVLRAVFDKVYACVVCVAPVQGGGRKA